MNASVALEARWPCTAGARRKAKPATQQIDQASPKLGQQRLGGSGGPARAVPAQHREPLASAPRSLRRNGVCSDSSCEPDGCGADRPARWEARMHGSQKTANYGGPAPGGKSTHAHARLRTTRGETAQSAPSSNAQGPHAMDTRARKARHARLPATRTLVQTTKMLASEDRAPHAPKRSSPLEC
jgi:hypothetical protein